MTLKARLLGAAAAAVLVAGSVQAETITIGLSSEPSAADPHFHNLGPNNQLRRHIFESLVQQDEVQQLVPGLATAWEPIDDTTWRFDLRQGVTFHDGQPFDAQDVVWTLCRIPNVPDSPSSFEIYTNAIVGVEIPDPHTLILTTENAYPLLPTEVSTWGIIKAPEDAQDLVFDPDGCDYAGTWPETGSFNSLELANGTGPYKLTTFTRGDRIVLDANPDYWGDAPTFEQVILRPITSDGPRVAALLAGDVDFIENPPLQDLPRLEADANVDVVQGLSNRVI